MASYYLINEDNFRENHKEFIKSSINQYYYHNKDLEAKNNAFTTESNKTAFKLIIY